MTVERNTRRRQQQTSNGIAPWVRNLVMLTALAGWAAVIAGYLVKGQLPDAPLLGVPGAVYLAMSPQLLRRRPRGEAGDEETTT